MANIKSIGGNPIVPASVEDGAITGAMIADNTIPDAKLAQTGGVLSTVNSFNNRLMGMASVNNIHVPANWGHSARDARVSCVASNGEFVNVMLLSSVPNDSRVILLRFFNGDTVVFSENITVNNYDFLRLRARADITSIGFYAEPISSEAYYDFYAATDNSRVLPMPTAKVLMGASTYANLDTRTKTITFPTDTIVCLSNGQNVALAQGQVVDFSPINTAAFALCFDTSTNAFVPYYYADVRRAASRTLMYVAAVRLNTTNGWYAISAEFPWSVDGKPYGVDSVTPAYVASYMGRAVESINHRGFSMVAPENTLPAFKLSKRKGFSRVETDISFTRDGVAVLLHDSTINRTARNLDGTEISETIDINSIDYADLANYDFGIWKGAQYAGTPIPTLDEFLRLCRALGMHPYLELKNNGNYTEAQIQGLVDMVRRDGMAGNVTWISFSTTLLGYVKSYDDSARLGYISNTLDQTAVDTALALRTANNEVFLTVAYTDFDTTKMALCSTAGLPLEVWTLDVPSVIVTLDPYISGVTSNNQNAAQIIYDNAIK